jgi:hypothetical protein
LDCLLAAHPLQVAWCPTTHKPCLLVRGTLLVAHQLAVHAGYLDSQNMAGVTLDISFSHCAAFGARQRRSRSKPCQPSCLVGPGFRNREDDGNLTQCSASDFTQNAPTCAWPRQFDTQFAQYQRFRTTSPVANKPGFKGIRAFLESFLDTEDCDMTPSAVHLSSRHSRPAAEATATTVQDQLGGSFTDAPCSEEVNGLAHWWRYQGLKL